MALMQPSKTHDANAWIGLAWMLGASVILLLCGLGLCLCRVI